MNTAFRKSFARDLRKIKDRNVLARVRKVIEEAETADNLQEIGSLKKIAGTASLFRIRIGDYRIGLVVEVDTIEFVRCLPRKDLYRFFP